MIKNMPVGRYLVGNSIIHKIDPRLKILTSVSFFVLLFFVRSCIPLALITCFTVFVIIFSGIPLKIYLKSNMLIMFTIFLTAAVNLFFGENSMNLITGISSISENGIQNSMLIVARLSNLTFMSSALMFTTSPENISRALESLFKPLAFLKINVQEIAMIITIALRFIPLLFEEADKIITAQRARGSDIKSKNLIKKARAFLSVIVPLFAFSFNRANDLALAMECRCYDSTKKRTKLYVLKIQILDILAATLILFAFLGVIACEIFL